MDDNDAFEAKLEAEPEAGGGLEANDDYNEVEIDTVLYCTVLCCTVLYCTVLYSNVTTPVQVGDTETSGHFAPATPLTVTLHWSGSLDTR